MPERAKLGGTDGFRGEFNLGTKPGEMNPATVALYSYAHVSLLRELGHDGPVVIGMDTRRFNTEHLLPAAIQGAKQAGSEVISLGVAPTPAILRTAQKQNFGGAIALTASHNKATDGGWKGTIGPEKPFGKQVTAIDERYWHLVDQKFYMPKLEIEVPQNQPLHLETYIADVVNSVRTKFDAEFPLQGKLVVVDAANGAAGHVTGKVLRQLGAEVYDIFNGTGDINEGCGATDLSGIQNFLNLNPEIVSDRRFVGAIANDGDADRMIAVGAELVNGQVHTYTLDGNIALELFGIGEPGVVGTVYTNDASIDRLRQRGTAFEFCDNGDVNVTNTLREHAADGPPWHIGAEFSGHIVDLEWLPSGDGILSASRLAALAATTSVTLAEIAKNHPLKPQILHNFKLPRGVILDKNDERLQALGLTSSEDNANAARSVARPSGTEPLFRLCVQAASVDYVRHKLEAGLRTVAEVALTGNIAVTEQRIA